MTVAGFEVGPIPIEIPLGRILLAGLLVGKALSGETEPFAQVAATDGQLGIINLGENPDSRASHAVVQQLAAEAEDDGDLNRPQEEILAHDGHWFPTLSNRGCKFIGATSLRWVISRT